MSALPANFVPLRRLVTDVSQEENSVVTTSEDHDYVDDQWVRLVVPIAYGMDVDYVPTKIKILSSTSFETNIDTRSLKTFVSPTFPPGFTQAHVVPISGIENNVGLV